MTVQLYKVHAVDSEDCDVIEQNGTMNINSLPKCLVQSTSWIDGEKIAKCYKRSMIVKEKRGFVHDRILRKCT